MPHFLGFWLEESEKCGVLGAVSYGVILAIKVKKISLNLEGLVYL